MMRKTFGLALVAMLALMGCALAEGVVDDGGFDPAAPLLKMTADAAKDTVTIENWGTAPDDIGTGQIVRLPGGEVLKSLPYTVKLWENPFTFSRYVAMPRQFRVAYSVPGIEPGDKLGLAFNVGYKCKCVAA
jgi:hypothetical protein